MCKGNRIREQHKTNNEKKTITITEPGSMNDAVKQHIRQYGAFTLFGSCPICGEFSIGVMRDVDGRDAEYYSHGLCGHKVTQMIRDYEHADFNKYVPPVADDAKAEEVAEIVYGTMARL